MRMTPRLCVVRGFRRVFLLLFCTVLYVGGVHAAVVRIDITSRTPYADGREFEGRGAYEMLRGKVHFAVDPRSEHNRRIIDLDLAPRDSKGRVEFSADVGILKPVDISRSNGAVFYDVNNRGNPTCMGIVAGGSDHFFARQGFIVVWSGWIAEVLPNGTKYVLRAPVATEDGKDIVGVVRAEMCPNADAQKLSISQWGGHGSYEPTQRGEREAKLTWRLAEKDTRTVIPRAQWRLEKSWPTHEGEPSALPRIDLVLAGGFQAGAIYELVYEAKGPIVQGLGLAGIRDLVSCFRYVADDRNPLRLQSGAPAVNRAHGFGTSQSGRCLRMFVHDGFNCDEAGRRVFDGIIPHVTGGGLGFFNHRFASPTRHNAQHDNHLYPADVFPFTYGDERDPFTGRTDGILRRSRASDTVPRVFHTQSSSEYWHRSGSLVHTDPLGQRDAEIPPEVRIYSFGGTQHGPGSGLARSRASGQLPSNPADYRPFLRSLVLSLDAWTKNGVEPPPSVYPRISRGELVGWRAHESGWRPLPGVRYPTVIQQPELLDRGPEFATLRRTTIEPPVSRGAYVVKVPAYGADNNERGLLMLPSVAVPVATYTSWNLRHRSIGSETELLSLQGGYIPFAPSVKERDGTGDPRLAVVERYGSFDRYLEKFRAWTLKLVEEGYILEEDVVKMERLPWRHEKLFE